MTARITLGDLVLGGSNTYEWPIVPGVAPQEQFWNVSAPRADEVRLGTPVTYSKAGVRKPLTVQQLYVLEVLPATSPRQRVLHVSDRRWLWSRKWISSAFNVRRATGDKFLVNNTDSIENAVVQPTLAYAKWSIFPPENGSVPWTALQVLDFVFKKLDQPYRIDESVGRAKDVAALNVQDLELDDSGAKALERVLAYLPGTDVYMDHDGTAVVYSTLPGEEFATTRVRGEPPFPFLRRMHATYPGDVQIVNRRALRPRRVHVLFTPEVEIRMNFQEGGTVDRDAPNLVNVAPAPEPQTTLADGRVVARGSYVPLETLFTAWGAFGFDPSTEGTRAVSIEVLRKHAFKHGWAGFEQAFANQPLQPFNAVYAQRAACAVDNWRRTYQVSEFFMQRLASIRAERVAILNTETGAYAPAEVFCDWVRRPSMLGLAKDIADDNTTQGWAVRGYAPLLANARVLPGGRDAVDVADPQAGIIRVHPQVDPYGHSQAMALGYPSTDGGIPSINLGKANEEAEDLYAQWDCVELEEGFKLAVVLTCVPASPNDTAKFHRVSITAEEANAGPADGPDVYIRVFPGVMTARFAWSDALGNDLVQSVRGFGPGYPLAALVNDGFVRDVALASAKRLYSSLRDGPMGSAAVDMDPDIKPFGNVTSVRHVMSGGVTETIVTFGAVRTPADIRPYLDASTRRAIDRMLGSGSGGSRP